MRLAIPIDSFSGSPIPPEIYLCTTGGSIIGQLPAYSISGNFKWNTYSEITFSVDRVFTDVITGESRVNTLFDKIEGPRQILVRDIGMFLIQDVDISYADKDTKNVTCFSAEYGLSSKYLSSFHINTGEVDSKEVIYESSKYPEGATADDMYKLANYDGWNSSTTYFHRVYTDSDSYTYEPIQVIDEAAYKSHFGVDIHPENILYIHGFANVKFYDPNNKELSLLHLILEENAPEWSIRNVDNIALRHKERKLSEDYINIYDLLTNTVSDIFGCVFVFDTINKQIDVYAEENDGLLDSGVINSEWETDVYISRENLASEVSVKFSTDNIKTKLKVSGADGLDIREINLGQNYIMNLDYYHNDDWMDLHLVEAYQEYKDAIKKYSPQYDAAMQGWIEANKKYNELMNNIPAESNVVLVGDKFNKLYCTYAPINTAYCKNELVADILISGQSTVDTLYADAQFATKIDKTKLKNEEQFVVQGLQFKYLNGNFVYVSNLKANSVNALVGTADKLYENGKLHIYNVFEDTKANNSDNILLTLKNANSDKATIRIYNAGTEKTPEYLIQSLIVSATTGTSMAATTYTMKQWVSGALTADFMGLDGYTISSIGTMGAYLVLSKNEKEEAVLEEYGINLLKAKHDTYVKIFQTQTEAMYSQQNYQCIVQNEQPKGVYDTGTKWLDTNSSPVKLYEYNKDNNIWNEISATQEISANDKKNYRNYQRYIDNYDKMVAIQKMLIKKQKEAEYWAYGEKLDRAIVYNGTDEAFYNAAVEYFGAVTRGTLNTNDVILTYTFITPNADGEWVIYLDGTTPYLMHLNSQGYWNAKKNAIAKKIAVSNFFTDKQWAELSPLIREDEYTDDNFLLTTYESEEERLEIYKALLEEASKKLKTLSQPSLEFSMTMANILALPEFEPLIKRQQFALGNFIRIELRPGLMKRARLLECSINFDDISDFNCTFGNLITTKSEIDLHAELLSQAVQAGKTVATAAGTWQAGADKANKLEEAIANGLQDIVLKIGASNGQAISWDSTGMHFRKFKDGSTTEYEPEEMAIINNALVATNDSWRTSKAAFGKYTINGETRWGPIAEYVTADIIEGKKISGGSIEIGTGNTKFKVDEEGNVSITSGGDDKYASKGDMQAIDEAYRYRIEISYDKSTVFSNSTDSSTLTCTIYDSRLKKDVTNDFINKGATFSWIRMSAHDDTAWNTNKEHINQKTNTITIKRSDVDKNAQFSCQIKIDETQLPSDETQQS